MKRFPMPLKPGQTTRTSFSKAHPRPGPGRRKMTEEEKRVARIKRAAEYDYKLECRALLPIATDQLQDELEKKKFKGVELMRVYETLRDTAHGKPAQTIQGAGGGPLVVSFTQILAQVDGGATEKIPTPGAAQTQERL